MSSYTNSITRQGNKMATVKTAISIEKSLYKKLKKLSEEINISRSQIFSQAVEYFINKKDNLELLKKINDAYSREIDNIDSEYLKATKKVYSKIIDKW